MKKRILLFPLFLAIMAFVPEILYAQRFTAGVDFNMRFDNREYYGSRSGVSQTLFSARITPNAGVVWNKYNSLIVGADLVHDFGRKNRFISDAGLIMYYSFKSEKFGAYAGFFDRNNLIGDYPDAFFSDSTKYYGNRINGFLFQYRGEKGYVEAALNWEGKYSVEEREKFRLISSGEIHFAKWFYGGYYLSLMHFANNMQTVGNVVDNFLAEPFVGARFNAFFDFDVRVGYLQSLQRDRIQENGWVCPGGFTVDVTLGKWGLWLRNRLYFGANQMPFYGKYGNDLYVGDVFYNLPGNKGIYNCTSLFYRRSFFRETLAIEAGFRLPYDGVKMYNQEFVQVVVDIQKVFGKEKKN